MNCYHIGFVFIFVIYPFHNYSSAVETEILDDSDLCGENKDIGLVVVNDRRSFQEQFQFCSNIDGEFQVPTNKDAVRRDQDEKIKLAESQDLDQCISSGDNGNHTIFKYCKIEQLFFLGHNNCVQGMKPALLLPCLLIKYVS